MYPVNSFEEYLELKTQKLDLINSIAVVSTHKPKDLYKLSLLELVELKVEILAYVW